jgi:hypothetical protein
MKRGGKNLDEKIWSKRPGQNICTKHPRPNGSNPSQYIIILCLAFDSLPRPLSHPCLDHPVLCVSCPLCFVSRPPARQVLEQTPAAEISLVVRSLPLHHVDAVMALLSGALESTAHLEFYLRWIETLLTLHGAHLLRTYGEHLTAFRALQKALARQHTDLAKLCHENQYQLDYLASFAHHDPEAEAANGDAEPQVEFVQKQTPAWAVAASSSASSSAAASNAAVFADDDDEDENENENEDDESSAKAVAAAAAAAAAAATRKAATTKPSAAAAAKAGAKKKQKAV